jgi:hypothetical protein
MASGGIREGECVVSIKEQPTYRSITLGGSRSKAPFCRWIEASSSMITNGSRHAELALAAKLKMPLWRKSGCAPPPNLLLLPLDARRVDPPDTINSPRARGDESAFPAFSLVSFLFFPSDSALFDRVRSEGTRRAQYWSYLLQHLHSLSFPPPDTQ